MNIIFLIILLLIPCRVFSADILLPGQPAPTKGVFLTVQTSFYMLKELEVCRDSMEELRIYKELDRVQQSMDKVRDEREALLKLRIAHLEKQQEELYKLNDQSIKVAEKMSKDPSTLQKILGYLGAAGGGVLLALLL